MLKGGLSQQWGGGLWPREVGLGIDIYAEPEGGRNWPGEKRPGTRVLQKEGTSDGRGLGSLTQVCSLMEETLCGRPQLALRGSPSSPSSPVSTHDLPCCGENPESVTERGSLSIALSGRCSLQAAPFLRSATPVALCFRCASQLPLQIQLSDRGTVCFSSAQDPALLLFSSRTLTQGPHLQPRLRQGSANYNLRATTS